MSLKPFPAVVRMTVLLRGRSRPREDDAVVNRLDECVLVLLANGRWNLPALLGHILKLRVLAKRLGQYVAQICQQVGPLLELNVEGQDFPRVSVRA